MDKATLQSSLANIKLIITATEEAILALTVGRQQSYTLNTGQSTQTVTSIDLADIRSSLPELYDTCSTLEVALNGATIIARPRG